MTKRMLIDSTHAEETRVVVLDGNRLEDYDVETSTKQQLKGNIYLAKIVRVEPSLQAAFVEFGGGRHGFLAFGEIHPDYYQIPVADRKRLLEMQEAEAREEEEEEEREAARQERGQDRNQGRRSHGRRDEAPAVHEPEAGESEAGELEAAEPEAADHEAPAGEEPHAAVADETVADPVADSSAEPMTEIPLEVAAAEHTQAESAASEPVSTENHPPAAQPAAIPQNVMFAPDVTADEAPLAPAPDSAEPASHDTTPENAEASTEEHAGEDHAELSAPAELPESIGGEHETDERDDRRSTPRFLRNYKIQEVMRRRQILLIQVVKEERGTKGAALTTYISLAGRFSVLMPNSPRGGGISRKITSAADRRRLKEITAELDLPRGMGLIVRTAGANRPKPEIIRDCEYLLNQWDQIRDLTMKSMAPALIYEEASLIKRAIRDVYSRDVDDILVDGEDGWKAARDFMRMLMPTHAKKVQLWKDPQPLFAKAQVEAQLDAMLHPNVQLRSGGYLVINQTEALVAIDVNSGRSTRERGIEETALRTNLEAAEETARQLRLRDLAGLIVIDFIDMESRRNNAAVEKKLKDALKNDRARIQVGTISHFGLMEMSRQRLRPSLTETSFVTCAQCGGTGHTRSTESAALAVLRGIEDEGAKRRSAEIIVHVAGTVAFYILNHKRVRLTEIEQRFGLQVTFSPDESMRAPEIRIERVRAQIVSDMPVPISQLPPPEAFDDPDEELPVETAAEQAAEDDEDADRPGETVEEGEQRRKKRRRRRRGGRRDDNGAEASPAAEHSAEGPHDGETAEADAPGEAELGEALAAAEAAPTPEGEAPETMGEDGERKRRGRRGGRRRRRGEPALAGEESAEPTEEAAPEPIQQQPAYVGPTPANPFGGSNAFDFFDAVEEAEQARALQAVTAAPIPAPAEETAPEPVAAATSEPVEPVIEKVVEPVIERVVEPVIPGLDPGTSIQSSTTAEATPAEQPAPTPEPAEELPPVEKKRGWWRS